MTTHPGSSNLLLVVLCAVAFVGLCFSSECISCYNDYKTVHVDPDCGAWKEFLKCVASKPPCTYKDFNTTDKNCIKRYPFLCTHTNCSGHGTCADKKNRARCICGPGYTGAECERAQVKIRVPKPPKCNHNTCKGHGTCSVISGQTRCQCDSGYTGQSCETAQVPIPPKCNHNTCKGHGTCSVISGQTRCQCDSGYTGQSCETETKNTMSAFLKCKPETCHGHGNCTEINGQATGLACETIPDICKNYHCGRHRHCLQYEGRAMCACPDGKWGRQCRYITNKIPAPLGRIKCTPDICHGHGNCTEINYQAKCKCTSGYSGLACEQGSSAMGIPVSSVMCLGFTIFYAVENIFLK